MMKRRFRIFAIAPWVSVAEASVAAGFHGGRECSDAAAAAGRVYIHRPANGQEMARGSWFAGVGRAPCRRAFRRGTAARGDRPGPRHRAARAASRRTYRRLGRAECLGRIRVAGTVAPGAWADVADRDAQPGPGGTV